MTRRLVTCVVLTCDACGAPVGDDSDLHFEGVARAEAAARDFSWTTDGLGRWHCAECPDLVDPRRSPAPMIEGQEMFSPTLGVDSLDQHLRQAGFLPWAP
jgi:hypothetical protein